MPSDLRQHSLQQYPSCGHHFFSSPYLKLNQKKTRERIVKLIPTT